MITLTFITAYRAPDASGLWAHTVPQLRLKEGVLQRVRKLRLSALWRFLQSSRAEGGQAGATSCILLVSSSSLCVLEQFNYHIILYPILSKAEVSWLENVSKCNVPTCVHGCICVYIAPSALWLTKRNF